MITLGQGRCYVATSAKVQYPSFFVNRYKHRGEELGYVHGTHVVVRGGCLLDGSKGTALDMYTHAMVTGDDRWRLVPRIEKEGSTPPITMNQKKHENFLVALFNNYTDLEKVRSIPFPDGVVACAFC